MIQLKRFRKIPRVEDRYGVCKITEANFELSKLYNLFPKLYDLGLIKFEFDRDIYSHENIKDQLIKQQHGKCAFCEQHILSLDYGDVEHFRPKGGYVQKNESIKYPGYFRLAYDFKNLMLCCKICNQRNKKNYFPIKNITERANINSSKLPKEKPFYINPYQENPTNLIWFDKNVATGKDRNGRGKKTIDSIGLNRKSDGTFSDLFEKRLEKLKPIESVYKIANLPLNNGIISNEEILENVELLKEHKMKEKEFSAMINDNFPL
ncbi:hypothetical protein [Flavobacterium sp. ENC]|uniref:hypothetical protein n=1 Tax=Flavobacterium sp. ENC TaxID=2897330 RepID=UPI001E2A4F37|nr:hypothetical protein [Flavobacterium sp. ENC]MCD0467234.1 hypothetical protein [Flavobacterium sp. ENC]